jgi:hypothetical protein
VKKNPKARRYYYEIEYDSAMIRFYIERFVAPARQGIDVSVDSPEKFYQALEAAERLERERRNTLETQALPGPIEDDTPPDKDKLN